MIYKVFVMLGNECNISCKYCMQHNLVTNPIAKEPSEAFYRFMERCYNANPYLQVCFYGGEPLIYFPTIKKICERLPFLAGRAGIISNGKALTDKIVDFINGWDMALTISWDGKNVMKTRGYDVMADPAMRHRLMRVAKLSFTGVISAYAYPMEILDSYEEFDKVYRVIYGYHVGVNLDTIFDTGLRDKSLIRVDYGRVKREMRELFHEYVKGGAYTHVAFVEGNIARLRRKYPPYCSCGNGYTVMNVDLEGNLYECHNVSVPIGHVGKNPLEYVKNLIELDGTPKRRETTCKRCKAYRLCYGGCKLMKKLTHYCKLKRAVYGTLVECVEEYGRSM